MTDQQLVPGQPQRDTAKPSSPVADPSKQPDRNAPQPADHVAQPIEIPGRFGVQDEPDRYKSHGPGGGRVVDDPTSTGDSGATPGSGSENPDRTRHEPLNSALNPDAREVQPSTGIAKDTIPL